MDEREFNLWKLLELIARRKRFIISFVGIITILAIITSFLLPKKYEAQALILPPKNDNYKLGWSGSSVADLISLTSGLQLPIMATATDVYARIFSSRLLAERVIKANNLDRYYNIEVGPSLFERVKRNSDFRVSPEGLLEVRFKADKAELAAAVVNSYVKEMDQLTRDLASDRARVVREFLEGRSDEVAQELEKARLDLKDFQKENKAIDIDRQTQLAIQAAVELKISLAKNEIDLSVKERSLSDSHPEVINLNRKIEEIKRQIWNLEFGGADSSYFNLPMSGVPLLRIQFAELSGKVKIAEALYKILIEQYEQAKIQEKMNTPIISVIDRAIPPELPIWPRKKLIAIGAFILSFCLALIYVLLFQYLDNLKSKSPEDYERAKFTLRALLGWLPGVKKSLK